MCVFTQRKEEIMLAEKENKEIKKAMNTLDFISEDPKEREKTGEASKTYWKLIGIRILKTKTKIKFSL